MGFLLCLFDGCWVGKGGGGGGACRGDIDDGDVEAFESKLFMYRGDMLPE